MSQAVLIPLLHSLARAGGPPGLVAHWPMDGHADDVSGQGHNGTLVGAKATPDRFGTADAALAFSGDAEVDIGSTVKPDFPFTISLWFRALDWGPEASASLFSNDAIEGPAKHGATIVYWDGYLVAGMFSGSSSAARGFRHVSAEVEGLSGEWHQVTAVFEGVGLEEIGLYLDGEPVPDASDFVAGRFELSYSDDGAGSIGGGNIVFPGFHGDLDDVRVYGSAMSGEQVQQLYEDTRVPDLEETAPPDPDLDPGGVPTEDSPEAEGSSGCQAAKGPATFGLLPTLLLLVRRRRGSALR